MSDPTPTRSDPPRGRWSVEVRSSSAAPVEEVWPLVGEARRWSEWSFLDRTELSRAGTPVPDGVGAVRRFTSHGVGSTEEVVAWEPPHHLGYSVLKGFPARDYRADVRCTAAGTGTLITWSATFDEKLPGTGHLMVVVVRALLRYFATSVARYADRQYPLTA